MHPVTPWVSCARHWASRRRIWCTCAASVSSGLRRCCQSWAWICSGEVRVEDSCLNDPADGFTPFEVMPQILASTLARPCTSRVSEQGHGAPASRRSAPCMWAKMRVKLGWRLSAYKQQLWWLIEVVDNDPVAGVEHLVATNRVEHPGRQRQPQLGQCLSQRVEVAPVAQRLVRAAVQGGFLGLRVAVIRQHLLEQLSQRPIVAGHNKNLTAVELGVDMMPAHGVGSTSS
jgi:hypothetical protein